ncbi:MAG: D-2-hydroxyacid dehydrogenase [Faecousia sp.]
MKRILVTDGMDKGALADLRNAGFEVVEQFYAPEELGKALQEFDGVVIRSATKVRKNHIDEALVTGRLKLIVRGGVGVDNIDVSYAEEHGIAVRNTPRASSNSVAELAMAHMFSCARFISIAGQTMREGKWEKKAYGKGIELRGKTLGVIGYGRIGKSLGDMAQALGMNVLAYDIYKNLDWESETMHYAEMDDILAKADFISVHTPAVPGKPLICAETIAKMKDGAVVINTSRGANVDEDALLDALNSGKLRAAGLDVWAEEPATNSALYTHPCVSCTPHIGAATKEAQARVGAEVVSVVTGFFA